METKTTIPKIQSLAIVLILAFIFNILGGSFISLYITNILSPQEYSHFELTINYASIIKISLGYLLNIILSIWIFSQSKDKTKIQFHGQH